MLNYLSIFYLIMGLESPVNQKTCFKPVYLHSATEFGGFEKWFIIVKCYNAYRALVA